MLHRLSFDDVASLTVTPEYCPPCVGEIALPGNETGGRLALVRDVIDVVVVVLITGRDCPRPDTGGVDIDAAEFTERRL